MWIWATKVKASRDCVSGIRLRGQRETVLLEAKERMKDGQRRKQADRKAKECAMGENKESSRMGNGGQK